MGELKKIEEKHRRDRDDINKEMTLQSQAHRQQLQERLKKRKELQKKSNSVRQKNLSKENVEWTIKLLEQEKKIAAEAVEESLKNYQLQRELFAEELHHAEDEKHSRLQQRLQRRHKLHAKKVKKEN